MTYLEKARKAERFTEAFFQASGQTTWPTVRQVSKACRIPQKEIQEFCDEGIFGLMPTSFNTIKPEPFGNWFLEICK